MCPINYFLYSYAVEEFSPIVVSSLEYKDMQQYHRGEGGPEMQF